MSRVAVAGLWQETNTYSSRPAGLPQFTAFELLEGSDIVARHAGAGSVIGGILDVLGDDAVPVFSAGAWPAAPPDRATADELLRRLERALAAAPEVAAVVVNLHGAMVAERHPDMELEALRRIRARWRDVPLSAVLDLHANPSHAAVALCDTVVGYRTYPHEDMRECGREAASLTRRMLGGAELATVFGRVAALTSPVAQGSDDEPMRGLLARAEARCAAAGAARISLFPGFPYADVDRGGFAVTLVIGRHAVEAGRHAVAETLADVETHLPAFARRLPGPEEAVARALALGTPPVVLADVADNVGGGSPGDGTAILAELLRRGVRGAVVPLADARLVAACAAAGIGGVVETDAGARRDRRHGDPVHVRGHVERLGDGRYRSGGSYMTGQEFDMGATAVLDCDGVRILAMERATPPFHVEQLTANGIDPAGASVIALKGAVAWRAPYRDVARAAIEVDTPGVCPADPGRLPRVHPPVAVAPTVPRAKVAS